jgi:hypothetical protein
MPIAVSRSLGVPLECTSDSTAAAMRLTTVSGRPRGRRMASRVTSWPAASLTAMVARPACRWTPATNRDLASNCSRIGGRPPDDETAPTPTSRTSPSSCSSSTIAETVGLPSAVSLAMSAREIGPWVLSTSRTSERFSSRITLWSAPGRIAWPAAAAPASSLVPTPVRAPWGISGLLLIRSI